MMRLSATAVASLVALISIAGCSSSTVQPQDLTSDGSVAEVTGFASAAPPFMGGTPSGPVTVRITGTAASRLALLVSQLPSVVQGQVHCEEPPGLMYRIAFGAGSVAQSKAIVEGYRCDAAVTVAVTGKTSSWRRDANCTLIRAVRQVLPGRARATRSVDIGCGG